MEDSAITSIAFWIVALFVLLNLAGLLYLIGADVWQFLVFKWHQGRRTSVYQAADMAARQQIRLTEELGKVIAAGTELVGCLGVDDLCKTSKEAVVRMKGALQDARRIHANYDPNRRPDCAYVVMRMNDEGEEKRRK